MGRKKNEEKMKDHAVDTHRKMATWKKAWV